jgi:hypothetical protein
VHCFLSFFLCFTHYKKKLVYRSVDQWLVSHMLPSWRGRCKDGHIWPLGYTLGYGLVDWGFGAWRLGIFLFTTMFRPALGPTQPPIQWVPEAISLGVKRPKSIMRGAIHPLPQHALMAWCSVKTKKILGYTQHLCYVEWSLNSISWMNAESYSIYSVTTNLFKFHLRFNFCLIFFHVFEIKSWKMLQ